MDIHIKKELKTEIYEEQYSRSPNLIGDLNMSCISNNFSSFFLDSLNDPSEFAKYLGNAENKAQSIDEQVFGTAANGGCSGDSEMGSGSGYASHSHETHPNNGVTSSAAFFQPQQQQQQHSSHQQQSQQHHHQPQQQPTSQQQQFPHPDGTTTIVTASPQPPQSGSAQQQQQTTFDSSFDFSKYLRHSEYGTTVDTTTTTPTNQLIDLDSTPPPPSRGSANNSADLDTFDHDSKHIFDVHNSNESTGTSDQRISSNTSECSDSSNQTNASKPLTKFVIKENFEVHQAHKVEEGIFQHMNKLPLKKKDTLKQLGVTFTGHMSVNDKSVIVENFGKFCQEYGVTDHRPFLTLNQSGMQKPEQIKFARYLGQGLPNFTLFCIYSNFKNLFCTKRFENYAKGSYNLEYILDKTKRFLTCTTADLKNLTPQMFESTETPPPTNNNGNGAVVAKTEFAKALERLTIIENYEVHESHRIEDGIFTHIGRLSQKKQELLKQFGIQSNHNVSYPEKHIIIENFVKFCRVYSITDHRPFLDFHESGLPKMEQIKFARYLGQGLPSLTLYKIYSAFKDLLALNRIEKLIVDGYNLDIILKKKKKNLVNRMNAAKKSSKESAEVAIKQEKLETIAS